MNIGTRNHATVIGLIAIVLWSTMVGLIHSISELIDPLGGIAMIYTCASALLIVTLGVSKIKTFSWEYLLLGILEFCMAMSQYLPAPHTLLRYYHRY